MTLNHVAFRHCRVLTSLDTTISIRPSKIYIIIGINSINSTACQQALYNLQQREKESQRNSNTTKPFFKMQNYAPWNPNRPLASIEEILGSETEVDALSHTSNESELVDSENGTSPKLLEAAESDTDDHSVSSIVRMTNTLE